MTNPVTLISEEPVTFEQAWATFEAKGYNYGEDALEQVRLGWDIAQQFSREPRLQEEVVRLKRENQLREEEVCRLNSRVDYLLENSPLQPLHHNESTCTYCKLEAAQAASLKAQKSDTENAYPKVLIGQLVDAVSDLGNWDPDHIKADAALKAGQAWQKENP